LSSIIMLWTPILVHPSFTAESYLIAVVVDF
jgi:hypothetical protein